MTPTAHTRENRGFASEIKFLVDLVTARRIRDWARARLAPDPYGEGPFGDEYRTTSLYFDTDALDVFHRRGSYGRSKYRIRRYDGESVAFLERKLRRATRLTKRRTVVPIEDFVRLAGACDPIAGDLDGEWPGSWFERRLIVRRLRPVCQISYQRLARVSMRDTGPIRLTLDEDVRTVTTEQIGFADAQGLPVLPHKMVLELKYRTALPAVFKQLVEEFTLTPQRVSKYRFAVDARGLAPEEAAATPVLVACSG